jgi:LysM repeat protein
VGCENIATPFPTETPCAGDCPPATETPTPLPPPPQAMHTVVEGDTWAGIAAQYGISACQLLAANGMLDPGTLAVGQVVLVPFPNYLPPQCS